MSRRPYKKPLDAFEIEIYPASIRNTSYFHHVNTATLWPSFIMSDHGKWHAICKSKQKRRDEAIPQAWRLRFSDQSKDRNVMDVPTSCGILSVEEVRITSDYDAVSLVEEVAKGRFTAEAVTVAFCKRAAIAHQLVTHTTIGILSDLGSLWHRPTV